MTPTDLITLRDRVVGLPEPDREVDARLASLDGLMFCWCGDDGGASHCEEPSCKGCGKPLGLLDERRSYPVRWEEDVRLPAYTSSIDAAVGLLERALPGWFWRVGHGTVEPGWAHLNRVHPDHCDRKDEATGYAATPIIALLVAILNALIAKAGEAG